MLTAKLTQHYAGWVADYAGVDALDDAGEINKLVQQAFTVAQAQWQLGQDAGADVQSSDVQLSRPGMCFKELVLVQLQDASPLAYWSAKSTGGEIWDAPLESYADFAQRCTQRGDTVEPTIAPVAHYLRALVLP